MLENELLAFRLALIALPLVGSVGLLAAVEMSLRSRAMAQFFKYAAIGLCATYVQTAVFYALATTLMPCLTQEDLAVKFFSCSAAEVANGVRAFRFAAATVVGFVVSNFFCWLMNRAFVFTTGKFRWAVELGLFYLASTTAMVLAIGLSAALIHWAGLMTTLAVFLEIVVSFVVNFLVRKFFIFKG